MQKHIDISTLPETASLADWGRILELSQPTLYRYRKLGLLPGKRLTIGNELTITKATVIKAFKIQSTTTTK
jgi:hypothetical protein